MYLDSIDQFEQIDFTKSVNEEFYNKYRGEWSLDPENAQVLPNSQTTQSSWFPGSLWSSQAKQLEDLQGQRVYYLHGFSTGTWEAFLEDFQKQHYFTEQKKFKPVLLECDTWQSKPVPHLTTDQQWGSLLRCCQMMVANSIPPSSDIPTDDLVTNMFNDDLRWNEAPFGIQNIVEVGMKQFAVMPGESY